MTFYIETRDNVQYRRLDDQRWLRQKRQEEKVSLENLSKEIGCPEGRLKSRLKKLEIFELPDETSTQESHGPDPEYPDLHNEKWLKTKYIDVGLTSKEIADRLGCVSNSVRQALSKHGIRKQDHRPSELQNESWIRRKYVYEDLTDREIGSMIDISLSSVRKARKKFGIQSQPAYPKLRDEEWLRAKWEDELLKPAEIGEAAGGASTGTVREWLDKHGII
ncbi:hypothetical protein HWV23_10595 [Natronomonas halophila]|uniref:hypothetical protein n=1 Tax=Natronomonas halophila TaxID=2747817 RepID=UPI0015B74515|nr:hypothetical protein [Natronomonas halophila]QLD86153.1 hypothetical protein HWV23_10595 [Natronomonas halophila]